jgi:hypothetical protein
MDALSELLLEFENDGSGIAVKMLSASVMSPLVSIIMSFIFTVFVIVQSASVNRGLDRYSDQLWLQVRQQA